MYQALINNRLFTAHDAEGEAFLREAERTPQVEAEVYDDSVECLRAVAAEHDAEYDREKRSVLYG
jgi:hypothetical protein